MMIFIGISLLVLTGLSWVGTGVVISNAAKKSIDIGSIQFLSALITTIVSAALLIFGFWPKSASNQAIFLTGGLIMLSGFINYIILLSMGRAMSLGPNGIVWAIIQSAFIFPFMMGIFCFDVPVNAMRIAGLMLIVCSVACYGLGKNTPAQGKKYGNWYIPAFVGFICAGLNQSLNNLPSYLNETENINSVFRAGASQTGTILACLVFNLPNLLKLRQTPIRPIISSAVIMVGINLICSFFFLYKALDIFADLKIGATAYPIIVSSCITGFFIFSTFILKEKSSILQKIGFVIGISGSAIICL